MTAIFGFVRVGDLRFGGPKNVLVLSEMAFGRCKGLGKVITHQIGADSHTGGEKFGVDCLGPGSEDRDKRGAMQILHKVSHGSHFIGGVYPGRGDKYFWIGFWKRNIVEAIIEGPVAEDGNFFKKN